MTFPYIPLTVDRFLNVRSDAKYGRYLDATEVTHWISGPSRGHPQRVEPVFRVRGRRSSAADRRSMRRAGQLGGGGGDDGAPVNLIELRCDDADDTLREGYEALAVVIASHFGWEVADNREGTVLWRAG